MYSSTIGLVMSSILIVIPVFSINGSSKLENSTWYDTIVLDVSTDEYVFVSQNSSTRTPGTCHLVLYTKNNAAAVH